MSRERTELEVSPDQVKEAFDLLCKIPTTGAVIGIPQGSVADYRVKILINDPTATLGPDIEAVFELLGLDTRWQNIAEVWFMRHSKIELVERVTA